MKLLPQEQKRLRQLALTQQQLSPDIKPEVTKIALEEFTKEVRNILQFKKTIKNAMVVLVETDKGDD